MNKGAKSLELVTKLALLAVGTTVMAATTIAYVVGLLLVGSGIALMALNLGNQVAASTAEVQDKVAAVRIAPFLLFGGLVITGVSLPWSKLGGVDRDKLDAAIDGATDWVVKLAELILLAAVFQLAAQRMEHWSVTLLAFLVFGCLAFHLMKPIARNVIRPIMEALPKKRWIGAIVGVALFVVVLILTTTAIFLLNVGLHRLLDTGITGM